MYRMDLQHFELLLSYLRESLQVDEIKAGNRSVAGAIIPELRLHCLVRWLAGGSYIDICSAVNIHPSTFDEDDPRNTTGTVVLPATVTGVSRARLHFVQRVRRMGLVRPTD
jgi:hypothetical protein